MTETRRLLDVRERRASRALYEAVFQDAPAFVDYYYQEICRDNEIFGRFEDGELLAMVHLNPYRWRVCGREVQSYYLVAVATRPDRRHQGHMRAVLEAAFAWMRGQGLPFCYLMPIDEAIYRPFDFHTVAPFTRAALSERQLAEEFELYCVQDERYTRRQQMEAELAEDLKAEARRKSNGQDSGQAAHSSAEAETEDGLPAKPVLMLKILDRARMAALCGLPADSDEPSLLAWLRARKIYFHEEV